MNILGWESETYLGLLKVREGGDILFVASEIPWLQIDLMHQAGAQGASCSFITRSRWLVFLVAFLFLRGLERKTGRETKAILGGPP